MADRTGEPRPRGWPVSRRWTALLVLLVLVFLALRGAASLAATPQATVVNTAKVVLVGVTGRYALDDGDRSVLSGHLEDAQAGAVSVRPRYIGDCAAAGWATLGAGRRTSVGAGCSPVVEGGTVAGWSALEAAAAARDGDARLGTLAGSVPGCVAAVGPGAALAAARPDGFLASYQTAEHFLAGGARTTCQITLVDAGADSDRVIAMLAGRSDVTLIVTGIGPAAGSRDPQLQVLYRLGAATPGWLTSGSTRRQGVVTLPDLTRTLIDFGGADGSAGASADDTAIDGAALEVDPATLTMAGVESHLRSVAALTDGARAADLALECAGAVVLLLLAGSLLTRRLRVARLLLAFCSVFGAAMMLTGAVPWSSAARPGLVLTLILAAWAVLLTAAVLLLSRGLRVPVAVTAAALTVAAITTDAALGGVMQAGSMLNSQPVAGGRWYGFGNVTFSVYAASGLLLAGYLAYRFLGSGHRTAALVAVAVVGFGIVVCEGWPSMGADFGGVISLTPGVAWLLLVLSGRRVTGARVAAIAASAVVAIALISYLDWRRGPEARTHLGNFVQRVIDGTALDVVVRKAVASYETIVSPMGIICLVVGIPLWVLLFRYVLPTLVEGFPTLRTVAVAALGTAVLGTLLNDGGISVWLTLSALFLVLVASLWVDRSLTAGRLAWAGRATR